MIKPCATIDTLTNFSDTQYLPGDQVPIERQLLAGWNGLQEEQGCSLREDLLDALGVPAVSSA